MTDTLRIKIDNSNTDIKQDIQTLAKAHNILVDQVAQTRGELLHLQSLVSLLQEDVKPFLLTKYKNARRKKAEKGHKEG